MNSKTNFCIYPLLSCIVFIASYFSVDAQTWYSMSRSTDLGMKLSVTSSLRDWSMNTKTLTGKAQFIIKAGNINQLTGIKSLTFSLIVEDLKSNEKAWDENVYMALKTDEYKTIQYNLTSAKVLPGTPNKYHINTIGDLTVAGLTREINMDLYCMINVDTTITCTGSEKLKMNDYEVKPPTFMLGVMKTGDEITLDFTLVYKK